MSNLYQSLSHSKWNCKYHVIFTPKKRKKILFKEIRPEIVKIFHELVKQKESCIIEGSISIDHVHMCIEILPKHAVSSIIGFLKGKSAQEHLKINKEILQEHISGREGTQYQQWDLMKRSLKNISKINQTMNQILINQLIIRNEKSTL